MFGHSGSGKTTLLRCIAGLERARQGFLAINGHI
ncbi:MAG: ATP-binding cassette domain-containing protein [Desulfoarculaceae bacterium]|nr:ATP-binding cassette domain-containing protein [Desulfoarculaceae bacterium]